ncbi:hypothetical protein SAMN05444274_106278 [Mariniphaga anaerophila]|uniref:Cytochrome c domain-containing protein n=1 Tax=Mariniphaga anaerophila TaxID=1484053 RepID=A0A1M5CV19_9BACT|nr:hypothetical protein [Mariniphaga anaerophila]SHF58559.1 hypothetical protein SAMN05444274_106278 [Mariniphaga anaerophila]
MKLKTLLLIVVVAMAFAGCKYDWIVPEEIPVIDPDDPSQTVSFSEDILPIFTSGNNCTACHSGNQMPDLRAENAYTSLNSTRYIDKTTPENSRIYNVPRPDGSHYKKLTAAQAALLLAWIQKGAENN